MPFRITTWNVNGIRNPFGYQPWREKRTFQAMFDILEADIVVMQETKIQRKDLKDDMVLVSGWDVYFSLPKHKKGYSGVAIYTRNSACCPIRAEEGITGVLCPPNSSTKFRDLPASQQIGGYPRPGQLSGDVDDLTLDSEGRCVILEFPAFVLIGTYSPANRDSSRDDFRIGYLQALSVRVRNLVASGKQVILTGDLNVIRSSLDTSNLAENIRKEGIAVDDWMSLPARRLFDQLIFEGNVAGGYDEEDNRDPVLWDICRCFHPAREGMFTCWDTRKNTRPANNGSRIDYVLCSSGLKDWFIDSNIQEGLMGSDHCPVYATLGDVVKVNSNDVPLLDLMNPEGMMRDGKRLRDWSQKDLLPMSAKLIPEFDRRQSIRDMFLKKPSTNPAPTTKTTETQAPATESAAAVTPTEDKESASSNSTPQAQCLPAPQTPEAANSKLPSLTKNKDVSETEAKSSAKRAAEPTTLPKRTLKKSKTNEDPTKTNGGGLSQSSLKGFFKPKQSPGTTINATSISKPETPSSQASLSRDATRIASFTSPQKDVLPGDDTPVSSGDALASPRKPKAATSVPLSSSAIESAEKVFDPIQAKESWSKLQLGKRVAPKCEHGEPCISLLTKKPGINCGRSFYICPRPLGPSGEKEKGTTWRCGTFIWSSDWKKDSS